MKSCGSWRVLPDNKTARIIETCRFIYSIWMTIYDHNAVTMPHNTVEEIKELVSCLHDDIFPAAHASFCLSCELWHFLTRLIKVSITDGLPPSVGTGSPQYLRPPALMWF